MYPLCPLVFSILLVVVCGVPHKPRRLSTGTVVKHAIGAESHLYQWITAVPLRDCENTKNNLRSFDVQHITHKVIGKHCYIEFESSEDLESIIDSTLNIDIEPNLVMGKLTTPWHLDRVDQMTLPLDGGPLSSNYDGSGVNVYVLDTGIRLSHEQFETRAEYGENFSFDTTYEDEDGHGTHCASTCCGKDYGVGSGAHIVSVKVLDANGEGTYLGLLQAFEWVLTDRGTTPTVVSMSLSGPMSSTMNQATLEMANTAGVIVVVAAGNEDDNANNYSPGSAGLPVITVGATDGTDTRASFSNYGDKVFVWAPGVAIPGAGIGSDNDVTTSSGTSMSTPIVAGIAASILEETFGVSSVARDRLIQIASKNVIQDPSNSVDNYLAQTERGMSTLPPISTPAPTSPTPPITHTPTRSPFTRTPTDSPTLTLSNKITEVFTLDNIFSTEVLIGLGAFAGVMVISIGAYFTIRPF